VDSLINNWTYGETSPKLAGRFDLPVYAQGCETLLNFKPMLQGGISRRPPLKHVAQTNAGRLIPFTLSNGESFLVELGNLKIRIWKDTLGTLELVKFEPFEYDYQTTEYSSYEIWDVQYAQYYDRVYFAHRNHKQAVLTYTDSSFGFTALHITCDDSENFGQTSDNYPGVVAICQNRLWYASTNIHPYTIWVSRPPYDGTNNHNLFTTFDTLTTETEVIKASSEWPKTINDDGDEIIDFSDSEAFMETIEDSEDVISAKCGMEIELASGRNDKIMWINGMNNILVGTESNEWLIPYDIDPTNQSASMQSSYGSLPLQADTMHDGIFFVQRGNRLREFVQSSDGNVINDLSFTADHIIAEGTRQIVCMKNPEPIIFLLLNNGSLAVLCYDKLYGMQGWAKWTTEGSFISIATREDSTGQLLYAIVKREDQYFLEKFDFSENVIFKDRTDEDVSGNLDFQSLMVSNRFDFQSNSGTSIGKSKKAREVWVRCQDSGRVSSGVEEKYMQTTTKEVGSEDFRIPISGGSRKELRIRIEAVDDDPLTLLAMTYDVEVN
jgi:hypothetical protein